MPERRRQAQQQAPLPPPLAGALEVMRKRKVPGAKEAVQAWASGGTCGAGGAFAAPPPPPQSIPEGAAVLPIVSKGAVRYWALLDDHVFAAAAGIPWQVRPRKGDGDKNEAPREAWRNVRRGGTEAPPQPLAEWAWDLAKPGEPFPRPPAWALGFKGMLGTTWDLTASGMYRGAYREAHEDGDPDTQPHDPRRGRRPSRRFWGVYLWTEGPTGQYWRAYLPNGRPVRAGGPGSRVVEAATEEEAAAHRSLSMLAEGFATGCRGPAPAPRRKRKAPAEPGPEPTEPQGPHAQGPRPHRCIRLCRAAGRCVPSESWGGPRDVEECMYRLAEADPSFRVTSWLLEGLGTWFTEQRAFKGAGGRFDLEYAEALYELDREALEAERARRAEGGLPELAARPPHEPPLPALRDTWARLEPWKPSSAPWSGAELDAGPGDGSDCEDDAAGSAPAGAGNDAPDGAECALSGPALRPQGGLEPRGVDATDGTPVPHRCTRLCRPAAAHRPALHAPVHLWASRAHLLAWLRRNGVPMGGAYRWMYEGTGLYEFLHGDPRSHRFDPRWMEALHEADRRAIGALPEHERARLQPWPRVPHECVHGSYLLARVA